jgi:hypothetical protein
MIPKVGLAKPNRRIRAERAHFFHATPFSKLSFGSLHSTKKGCPYGQPSVLLCGGGGIRTPGTR